MPKEYIPAPDQVVAMIDQVLNRYYPELIASKIKIGAIVQNTYEEDELVPGLKLHGASCAATISKVSAKHRLYVPYDAQITIDGFWWDQHPDDAERMALIDHEIQHVLLVKKNEKVVITEDGHPKFKLRPDEINITGFLNVVARHGMAAGEAGDILKAAQMVNEALEMHKTYGGPKPPEVEMTFTVVPASEAKVAEAMAA
jgi:hypothetical protein